MQDRARYDDLFAVHGKLTYPGAAGLFFLCKELARHACCCRSLALLKTCEQRLAQLFALSCIYSACVKMGKGKKVSAPQADGQQVDWQVGQLAVAWEANSVIRARGRTSESLTKWMNSAARGIASMGALSLNPEVMLEVAVKWCPLLPFAKSPPIPLIRAEANRHEHFLDELE